MSDFLDRMEAALAEGLDATEPDQAGLINRVSAAGFQVSQAMEGLDQVAGLLRAAEQLAKDADARRREAEDEAALAEGQARELGELLSIARSDAADVEHRLTAAEERASAADSRRQEAEDEAERAQIQAKGLGELLATARSDADDVGRRMTAAEERAKAAEARLEEIEDEAERAKTQAKGLGELLAIARSDADDVGRRVTAAEERAKAADARREEAEDEAERARAQAREVGDLLATTRSATDELQLRATAGGESELRAAAAEERATQAEDEAAFASSRARELGDLLAAARSDTEDVERRAAAAEERATQAEDRLQQALERAFTLEAELDEANDRVPAPKTPRQITVIVDDQRDELRDSVASEIRRPLSSIMGLTLALKHTDPASGDGKHLTRQLGASARRLERLVVQLLELDGIANGSYTPTKRRADLKAIVRRVVEETPDVDGLDVRGHAEHAALEVDPALTEQMVETLLANAARRSEAGSPVWVQVASDPTGAVIAVEDTCPEVPTGMVDEGPASRQKKARGATGLALLSRLAELHGGRAWVEERPGGGASFRVFLPSGSATGGPTEPRPAASDQDEADNGLEDDHHDFVVDAASIASREPELDAEPETEPVRSQDDVYAGLRELSSFDDLSDELAL